jgi:hypothetical protein
MILTLLPWINIVMILKIELDADSFRQIKWDGEFLRIETMCGTIYLKIEFECCPVYLCNGDWML